VTADYLAEKHPSSAGYLVGEAAPIEELREAELTATVDFDEADVVVTSMDRSSTTRRCPT
jgi:ribonucleotide monophosphatase NagD (HAD superfamily)